MSFSKIQFLQYFLKSGVETIYFSTFFFFPWGKPALFIVIPVQVDSFSYGKLITQSLILTPVAWFNDQMYLFLLIHCWRKMLFNVIW